ncbi:PAS domain-containing sensor histidine kinase [Cyclobacterium qasimii]|uniref:histidine kinase n=2 Tax=Cyclobacterium qasimii TaxID=1350429 RepID=S7VAV9_9BACT|nr:PAS domain-containing sensor histidine kinase [Cyclobacterium qasimii]EPR67121.1 Formate hydrogenlyase transcriptional activator [Cyclobacterium qasimii M12-11B]GEO19676.1 hypothetical protein CQA01_02100 [Cyclobacterium qasimii]
MNKKPTYQELENQIAALKKQNEVLRSKASVLGEKVKQDIESLTINEKEEESEKFTHTVLNNMGDSVFVKDDQSKLILVNDAFCEIFKLSRAEVIGKTLAENVPPDERESFLKIDNKVLKDGVDNTNEESLTVRGQTRMISTRKSRFIDASGKKFLIGVIRDISESKKAELALKKSEGRFREINATKDKLFSIIAHDLRGPFNNIIGLSELLSKNEHENVADNEQSEKYIEIINSTAKSTLTLLDNLLNWANSQTGGLSFRPEKIILSEVILEIIDLEKTLSIAKNITLKYTTTKEIAFYTDENILKTILRNLISNAIKFTNPGGNINVITATNEQQVEITIADNGIGMSEETADKLFDISTNITSLGTANEKGSGLGLVLCREFVEKLGGNIWVESVIGKGSNFIFNLPLNFKNRINV